MPTFFTWFLVWLTLIYLPRILLTGVHWLDEADFLKSRPDKVWLFNGYKLFLILWLPLSFMGTARLFLGSQTNLFFLYVIFVPSIGAGLLKGLIETISGIGWFYGWRLTDELIKIYPRPFGQSYWRIFWFHFTLDHERVRFVGIIRLMLNTAVLITLVLIALR